MPRPRLRRRIRYQPDITYFKPAGVRKAEIEEELLTYDELEAVRLKDVEDLGQGDAAKKMGISQPTFHRLLVAARKKIANAIVEGKAIRIQGGDFKMMRPRSARRGRGRGGAGYMGAPETCICTKCGHKETKKLRMPCSRMKCPKCGAQMIRGD